jgi:hypothetical protein
MAYSPCLPACHHLGWCRPTEAIDEKTRPTFATMKTCPKFTFGVGDRFAHGAHAQLNAFMEAAKLGIAITPVWNKSNREHLIIGSEPLQTRQAADRAVSELGWTGEYLLDADHINLTTVDRFVAQCDFFTLDVADDIGEPAEPAEVEAFIGRHPELLGSVAIAGIAEPFVITREDVTRAANKFLKATAKAGQIYRHILDARGGVDDFVTEVSMDETDSPQTPPELLIILAALAEQDVPVQTIAPKFTGRFNKGVDYVGDAARFETEFNDDLAVIAHAVDCYGLPSSLKLSVHSGSDKFSIYPAIRRAIRRTGAGLHIKTAGTNWLEEIIGLAEAGGSGLELAKTIYAKALAKKDELCGPYATVIDIREQNLPSADEVNAWTSEQFTSALRHDPTNPGYNPDLRQLLHVGFKIAAQLGDTYLQALRDHSEVVARNVTTNLLERHMKPLFL